MRMKRPREPAPGECCGSGCTRCVWDIYYDEVARFEEFLENGGVEEEDSEFSSEEEGCTNYVGSVVVKYIAPPALSALTSESLREWERAEMRLRGFHPVDRIELLRSSAAAFAPSKPGISVVEICTSGVAGQEMLPGDVVEVLVPNSRGTRDADDVDRLCCALHLNPDAWCELHRSPFVPEDHFPPWLPLRQSLTVGQLLSLFVDISSSSYLLHPSFFEGLLRIHRNNTQASATRGSPPPDPKKVRLLEACASAQTGPRILRALAASDAPLCYPSLVDVLETFSFVQVPLDRLLEVSGPLQTRKYSLANWLPPTLPPSPLQLCVREVCAARESNMRRRAPLEHDTRAMAVMLNAAAHSAANEHGAFFFGHTSHPICRAARLTTSGTPTLRQRDVYVSYSLFGTSPFAQQLQAGCAALCDPALAKSLRGPVCLVGCGNGVAPLIAAVTQLVLRRTTVASGSAAYPCWVFYGARTRAELLYDETLRQAESAGAVAKYEFALSREEDAQKHGVHVTDLLRRNRALVAEALQDAGQVFVCGPTRALQSVRELFKSDLLAEADDDDSVQEQRVRLLEEQGRLSFDIWSTGNIFE